MLVINPLFPRLANHALVVAQHERSLNYVRKGTRLLVTEHQLEQREDPLCSCRIWREGKDNLSRLRPRGELSAGRVASFTKMPVRVRRPSMSFRRQQPRVLDATRTLHSSGTLLSVKKGPPEKNLTVTKTFCATTSAR